MHRLAIASLALTAFTALACGAEPATTPVTITLQTGSEPSQACEDALLVGRLVADTQSGLAVQASHGEVSRVMWPFRYSARYANDRLELLDPGGSEVAAEGDTVEMGGGFGPGGLFYACAGSVRRAQPFVLRANLEVQ